MAEIKESEFLDDRMNEYTAIRSEILTWISVKYSMIAISASVTAISLSLLGKGTHWSWFSAALISIIGCLGFLASHANAKVTIASAYISVVHPEKTHWEHFIYGKVRQNINLATMGYVIPSSLLYLVLLVYIILYPAAVHAQMTISGLIEAIEVLFLPVIFYAFMILSIWKSERRGIYEVMWKEIIEKDSTSKHH